jgi:thiol-disulfide isomerase/thioredoxin
MKLIRCFRLLALAPALLAAVAGAQTLKPGDPAPPIKVAAWTQGGPVEKFLPGKVYVVEFWATWCGPCRTSIPHLDKLSKKYAGKVEFIGVSVWEFDEDPVGHVARFVKEMGDQMTYTVAVDDAQKTMATTWMEAAAQEGVPSAFIVGKEGKILWIGHPMEMDEPLAQVVAGTFDAARFAAEYAEQQAGRAARMEKRKRLSEAETLAKEGKTAEALKIADELAKDGDPEIAQEATMTKLDLLAAGDRKAFEAAVARLVRDKQFEVLAHFAFQTAKFWGRAQIDGAKVRLSAAKLAADAALKDPKPDAILYYLCGVAYGEAGEKALAARTLQAGVKAFDADPEMRANEHMKGLRRELENLIAIYQED